MLKDLPAISPASFYSFSLSIKKKKSWYVLPDIASLEAEDSFVTIKFRFTEDELSFRFEVDHPFQEAVFPQVEKGDGIELFLDTRDMKNAKAITKFCHHFVFLPAEVDGIWAAEVTKFRSDETHPYPDHEQIKPQVSHTKNGYALEVLLTKDTLFGYDPTTFSRIGFACRVHRKGKTPYFFGPDERDLSLASAPDTWPSVHLRL